MKCIKYISAIILLIIVLFVNLNEINPIWDAIYYSQYYIIVGFFIYIGFKLNGDVLTKSLLLALGFYYSFEITMDIINIINSETYYYIYSTRFINYVLCVGCVGALLILPLMKLIKKWKSL